MKKFNPVQEDYIVRDEEGNIVPAFETDKKNEKKNVTRTSTGYTVFAALLYILTFMPIAGITLVLAFRTRELMPYYGIWPFIGTIIVGVFAIIFYLAVLLIARKHSKKSIMSQTAKLAAIYAVLTTVFSLLITYAFPDAISYATQQTIHGEDVMFNGEKMVEQNAKLERQYILYNILNGNLGGECSYHDLADPERTSKGVVRGYKNDDIQEKYDEAMEKSLQNLNKDISSLDSWKAELFDIVYNDYILTDMDYAFASGETAVQKRRALAFAITRYVYANSRYEEILQRGFTNNATDPDPELNAIFNRNFNNFNQDGYITFDDEHLLLAQIEGRMTIPVVINLILDDIYQYTQPSWDDDGNLIYLDENNFLYQLYDPKALEEAIAPLAKKAHVDLDDPDERAEFLKDEDHEVFTEEDEDHKYFLYNKDGWRVYASGKVYRPIKWVVLDMLGEGMAITTLDVSNFEISIADFELNASIIIPIISGVVGGLVADDLPAVLQAATNGANLGLGVYLNDDGGLVISVLSNNAKYGMLGYMQASWVGSDHLLMAVYNVVSVRNWFALFGAFGVVLIIAAGVLRDCGKKVRERGYIAIDRLNREKATDAALLEEGETVAKPKKHKKKKEKEEPEEQPEEPKPEEKPAEQPKPTQPQQQSSNDYLKKLGF